LKQQIADDARNTKRLESESTGKVAELNARLTVAEALVEEKQVRGL
jgi:phage host-nuclease inhibitor protein Gam